MPEKITDYEIGTKLGGIEAKLENIQKVLDSLKKNLSSLNGRVYMISGGIATAITVMGVILKKIIG